MRLRARNRCERILVHDARHQCDKFVAREADEQHVGHMLADLAERRQTGIQRISGLAKATPKHSFGRGAQQFVAGSRGRACR